MIVNEYFKDCKIFTNFTQFEKFVSGFISKGNKIDYVVICSPNFLHYEHISWALMQGINVICEKPLVLQSKDLNKLVNLEKNNHAKVFSILQLRYHEEILKLKEKFKDLDGKKIQVNLTYITPRDDSYLKTWKGNNEKSGGIVTNIGIHFFDMLYYLFGNVVRSEVHYRDSFTSSGFIEHQYADVQWFLSIDMTKMPTQALETKNPSYRSITIDDDEVNFSGGFEELHSLSYQNILSNRGFGIEVNRPSIEIVEKIRTDQISNTSSLRKLHPFLSHE